MALNFVRSTIFILSIFVFAGPISATDLRLTGEQFWVVLASRQDADDAISVARRFEAFKPMVVRASNGWFAVITGPSTIKSGDGRNFLQRFAKERNGPTDAYLTKGAGFNETIWTIPPSPILAALSYDGEKDAAMHFGGFEIKLSKRATGNDEAIATAKGTYKGKPAFEMELGEENPTEKPASNIYLVRLDPTSPAPQVVFTYFWGGAHCCTITKIASLGANGWVVIDGETLDGAGYGLEPSSDGIFSYLISADQSFLYAFDSYAGSIAPTRISKLSGGEIVDVTKDPLLFHLNLQNLYSIEQLAKEINDGWHSNGFLAGWVAESALVGREHEAWEKMLTSYDHDSNGSVKCLIDKKVWECPKDKRVELTFPWALRDFLIEHGYIASREGFSAPR